VNARQFAQQIKHKLEAVTWPAGSQDVVFGTQNRVVVYAGTPTEEQIPPGFPWALVGIGPAQFDADDPGLATQELTVTVGASVAGDPMGAQAITGGPILDQGKSAGRGVGDLVERALSAVRSLLGSDGAKVILSAASTGSPTALGRGRHLAIAEVSLSAVCTAAEHWSAPQRLRYSTVASVGRWTWEGSHCEARYDFYRYRLVRKQGTTPSVSPSDGTTVYTGTEAKFVGSQNSGYVYTIFCDYNSRGAALVEGSSSAERGAYRTV